MVALAPGTKAPGLSLKTIDGNTLELSKVLQTESLALLAFFKVSCPVCQFTAPYLDRLHRAYPELPIWGVSQDDLDDSVQFARSYGCSFPILLDEDLSLSVNYGLTNVPSIFLVDKSEQVKLSSVGFVKEDLEQINRLFAEVSDKSLSILFTEADNVPALRPG